MTAIWNASAVTPLATDRIPVDVSSSGAASRWTGQNIADINTIIGGTVTALGSIGTNTALNLALGGYFSATITGNLTFSITNVPASAGVTFVLALTNGGAFTVTLPGSVTIIGGSPVLSAAGTDWLVFRTLDGGTAWTLEVVGNPRDADLATWATITPGTGVATALGTNVGTAGSVVVNGGAGGTPSSITLTNATGYPAASTSASGIVELAIASEVDTGTDATRAMTPDSYRDSTPYYVDRTADWTLAQSDANTEQQFNSGSARVCTIETNANAAISTQTVVPFLRLGSGSATIDAVSGVTLNGVDGASVVISTQYQGALLRKTGTNAWVISGDIT